MRRLLCGVLTFLIWFSCFAQDNETIAVKVVNAQQESLSNATVELLQADSTLLKVGVSDSTGSVQFTKLPAKAYLIRTTLSGYKTSLLFLAIKKELQLIFLQPSIASLQTITVSARKPFIELHPDKTVINLEAGISTIGTTALEALEKLPGITIDKDGNISLKGRSGVIVMMDGKPTYLNGAELATLLNGMSASQITQVELMDNPPAKYDAAGNAGIINIKIKKNNQRGFNGSITTSFSQGFYPKNNNNIAVNYRSGKVNVFANYSLNISQYFTRIYALRTYFKNDGATIASLLEQPSFIKSDGATHNLKTGIDYTLDSKTALGLTLYGLSFDRTNKGANTAQWMKANRTVDSLIRTKTDNHATWENAGATVTFRHSFSAARELTADIDAINYRIRGSQFFENNSIIPGSYSEASRANIPTDISILSAKADYAGQFKNVKAEGGWKTSYITTDNMSSYQFRTAGGWKEDLGKSNHFLYNETIHALYGTAQSNWKRFSVQGGLRYEMTSYKANQLGNAMVKDSSFSRQYNSLFPSLHVSFEKDSSNTFSVSTSRRIDRPAFQKLNPFLFIINKYTYQRGDPYYRPQYTWNIALNHVYKNKLISGLSYSVTNDYFSQIFPLDSNGIVIYTEGNLGRLQNFGLSLGLQLAPSSWWSFSLQTVLNHKNMEGIIIQKMMASVTQYNINLNNQFRFNKGWGAELTGFYNSKSQHDIQEVVDPAGQVSLGVSKSILKTQGSLKLAVRDIFYTNWMKGLTQFTNATEYFKLTRDTRVATISFTWRFGKLFKATKRSEGSAGDEMQRVGSGS